MPNQKLDGYLAKRLFAAMGDDSIELGKYLNQMVIAHSNGDMPKLLNRLGLAQEKHEAMQEIIGLLIQGRVEEAFEKVGMNGIR